MQIELREISAAVLMEELEKRNNSILRTINSEGSCLEEHYLRNPTLLEIHCKYLFNLLTTNKAILEVWEALPSEMNKQVTREFALLTVERIEQVFRENNIEMVASIETIPQSN